MYRQWYLLIMSLPLFYPHEIKKTCEVDSAKKPVMLELRCHVQRRMDGRWNWRDVYRNRFFIKQAEAPYFVLLIIGICPISLMNVLFDLINSIKRYFKAMLA